ncbi:MAG: hypothetical protein ACREAE_05415 [Nitrosopumilaceae archaeon]
MIKGIPVLASRIPATSLMSLIGIFLMIPTQINHTIRQIATNAPVNALTISIRLKVANATKFSTASNIAI